MIKQERTYYAKDVAKLTKKIIELQSTVDETLPKILGENQLLKESLNE